MSMLTFGGKFILVVGASSSKDYFLKKEKNKYMNMC
jgi:hypothetical protein